MINYSHNTPLDILYIIKQLVSGYNGKVEKLLPIRGISKGFKLGKNIQKFKFKPPKEYKKEGYEVEVPLGDDEKRVEEFTRLNNDIREHNKWAIEQNEKLGKQLLIKAPAAKDVIMEGDAKDLGIHLDYPKLDEYDMWQIPIIIENPQDKKREFDPYDRYSTIDNRQLYAFAKELPEDEFVQRFNKTIFDYLLKERKEVEELGIWDSEHIWWHPVREFSMWFNVQAIDHRSLNSLSLIDEFIEKKKWPDALWSLADELRYKKIKHEFPSYMDAYRYGAEKYVQKDGSLITAESLRNAYHKAKSSGKVD